MSDISITTSAVPDSGSSAPSAAPAAPSVPATPPSDTGAGTPSAEAAPSAPLSFAQALAKRAADAETPPATPIAEVPPTVAPETPADSVPTAPQKGPIPFDRHQSALENARIKTTEQVTAQFHEQHGPSIQLGEAFRSDPVGTALGVLQELQGHPMYAPQLASAAGKMLASRRGGAPAGAGSPPGPDLTGTDANGQPVQLYSAGQQAKRDAWIAQQVLSQVRQELAPIQADAQQARAEKAHAAQRSQIEATAKANFSQWQDAPGFHENLPAIRTLQAELHANGMEPWAALGLAYQRVVAPWLQAQTQDRLRAEAARKSAGTTDNPARVTPSPAQRSRSFAAALERAAAGR